MNLRDIILDAAKEAINNDDSITKKDLMVILDKQEAEIRLLKQPLIRSKEVHLIYANPEKFSKELGEDNSYYDPQPPMRRTVYGSGKKAREIISEIDKVIIDSSLLKPRAVSNKTIEDAIHLAKSAHEGQSYDGKSYFEGHLELVANLAKKFTYDKELIAGCYLHDTVEDTKVSLEMINSIFGDRVARMVDAVTDGEGRTREEKKRASYEKLSRSSDGRFVKLCDRITNMTASISKPEYASVYLKESDKFITHLFVEGEYPEIWEEYHRVIALLGTPVKD